jgi:hypothetical protein
MLTFGRILLYKSISFLILLLAYPVNPLDDPGQSLFFPNKDNVNNDEELFDLINKKQTSEKKNCFISCDLRSLLFTGQPSRRDTHFLRFGRKR